MGFSLHPRIGEHSLKILRYRYNNDRDIIRVLNSLPLSKDAKDNISKVNAFLDTKGSYQYDNSVEIYTLDDYMKALDDLDVLLIVKDILIDSEIKKYKNSNWQVYWEPIKNWRPDLLLFLKENGIIFDEEHFTFQTLNHNDIKINAVITGSPLIDVTFSENFYDGLIGEINGCYQSGFYTAAINLSRKLVENLFIEVLRKKYPPNVGSNLSLYFLTERGRFKDFSDLMKSLEDKKDDFITFEREISEILELVEPFKEHANSKTHSITSDTKKKDVDDVKVVRIVNLLKYVLDRI